jgi:flagellar hook-associated protein 1 FlgK
MSSFSSLHIGASALFASSRAVEVAAHNVANANTAGFTRQRLEVQTATPTAGTPGIRGDGMRGMGVTVLAVDRLRDRLADVAYRSEASVAGASAARSSALSRTESVLGPYGQGGSEAYSRFLAAWDSLSLNPSDAAARSSVLAAGDALANSLRGSAQGLVDVSREIGLRVQDQVGELNGLLDNVATLNLAIQDAVVAGSKPNDLLDQRDTALDRITYLTGARVEQDGSSADVLLGDTPLVARGTAARVAASGTPLTLAVDGRPTPATGQLGGYLSAVNSDLPDYSARLDALALGLRDAVNAVHTGGRDLSGTPGRPFFTGDSALELRVDPALTEDGVAASRSGQAADGENALAMSELRTRPAVGTATVAEALRAFGGRVGQAVVDAERNAANGELSLAGATATRAAVNGVNVDEEMVDLVKFQHAYSAASRVISVIDDMLNRIINEMGR